LTPLRHVSRLAGVQPALIGVIYRAAVLWTALTGRMDAVVIITEGIRSRERQHELVRLGKSQTMNSYHLVGKAIDVALAFDEGETVTWDFEVYRDFNECVQQACDEFSVVVTWGGEWETLRDGPHFQLEMTSNESVRIV